MHTKESVDAMDGGQVYDLLKDVAQRDLLRAISYLCGLNPAAGADVLNHVESMNAQVAA